MYDDEPKLSCIYAYASWYFCLGESFDQAFEVAGALEKCCEKVIKDNYLRHSWDKTYSVDNKLNYFLNKENAGKMPEAICDLGSSVRNGNIFTLTYDGGKKLTLI